MRTLIWGLAGLAGVLLLVLALALLAGRLGMLQGRVPVDLGVNEGRLKPPSTTDNSVSSQAGLWPGHPRRLSAAIEPLALAGDGPATMQRLHDLVAALPLARIVAFDGAYLRAEFSTPFLRFTDDAEFWLDPAAGVVQLRSASRLGRRDFGVNRERVEAIRTQLHTR